MPLAPGFSRYRKNVALEPGETMGFRNGAYYARTAAQSKKRPSYTVDQQAGRDVARVVNPQVDEITRSLESRAKAGMGAIEGYTNRLAENLGGYQANARDIYQRAQQAQTATDAALRGTIQGTGSQLAQELSGKLGQIGAPSNLAAELTGGIASTGMGAGNAAYARGSADLTRLIAQGAGAEEYAGKLPGIARLGGRQDATALKLASQRDISDQTGQIRAKVPELVLQRGDQIRERIDQRKSDALDYEIAQAAGLLNTTKAYAGIEDQNADRASRERIAAANRQATNARAAAARAAALQKAEIERDADKQTSRRDAFYEARKGAFADAAAAFGAGRTPQQVKTALVAQWGKFLLGRGFSQAMVNQMIANAMQAGKANPKKTGKTGSTSGTLVP